MKREADSSPLSDPRWWAVAVISGIGAYVASSHALFFLGGAWQIPLFVGCVVGLVAVAPPQAMPVAAGVTLASMGILPPVLPFGGAMGAIEWLLALVLSVGAAAAVSYARAALHGEGRRRFGLAVSAALVAWTLVNLWLPLYSTGLTVTGYGPLPAAEVTAVPQAGTYVNDDAIYRRVYYLMHQGEGYYPAFRDAWLGLQRRPQLPNTVAGYRLPTWFWVWAVLPADPFSIVYLFLAVCSVGVVASALVAGQLVGARFAPLAAVALAAYVFSVGSTVHVMYVDLPAACIALVGIALFVRARLKESAPLLWAAAAALALAALTREILAYVIVLAALSALLEKPGARLRAATPWLTALGVFAIGYAAHWVAASPYVVAGSGELSYLSGSPSFALAAVTQFALGFNGGGAMLAALFTVGLVGAYAAQRRVGVPFSAFAMAALVLPVLAMVWAGNPGIDASGREVNYWGMLFVPLALSLWPVWALLLQRRESKTR